MIRFLTIALLLWIGWGLLQRVRLWLARRAEVAKHSDILGKGAPAEEMVKCSTCGVYISATHAAACERADCPRRR